MPMRALKFQPGINSDVTSYSNEGGFVDGNKIRFRFGFPEKFCGWEELVQTLTRAKQEDYIIGWR